MNKQVKKTSSPIRIALADDHQLVRRGIKLILEDFPEFKVIIEAANGKELLEKIKESTSIPHIAIVDVSMPIMDGYATTQQLNSDHSEIKVVALSVHDDLETVNRMIESGANAYLLKDADPQKVKNTLLEVYEKGYYYDQLIIDSFVKAKEKEISLKRNRNSNPDLLSLLTPREKEFIQQCCSEKTYKEIADVMNISTRTVDGYRESVFSKMDIKSRTGIVLFAIQSGIVSKI